MNKVKPEVNNDDTEGPLDFTINSDKNKNNKNEQINETSNDIQQNDNEAPDKRDLDAEINARIERETPPSEITPEVSNPEQTLPKFKITRLGNKMAKIVAKPREPAESSRPLRKRRRLVEVSSDEDPLMTKTRKIVQV